MRAWAGGRVVAHAIVRIVVLATSAAAVGLGPARIVRADDTRASDTHGEAATSHSSTASTRTAPTPTSNSPLPDARAPLATLYAHFESLAREHGWEHDLVYAYPDDATLQIRAWRTPHRGPALWLISGIHGEEPAGPNAISTRLAHLARLADTGVPIVLVPLANPKAYRSNWRYPNTPERDWRKGGYSVGDAEHLLPDLERGAGPREPAAPGPETAALTAYVLRLAAEYPPLLVLDLHEDELSTDGGYIYSQGTQPHDNPVGARAIRLLEATGIPLRKGGRTRFGEPIDAGVISRNDDGTPIRDGSIDELLASPFVFVDGERRAGPAGRTVIVVETPAFAGSRFDLRVAAQGAIVEHVDELWRLAATVPAGSASPTSSPAPPPR